MPLSAATDDNHDCPTVLAAEITPVHHAIVLTNTASETQFAYLPSEIQEIWSLQWIPFGRWETG